VRSQGAGMREGLAARLAAMMISVSGDALFSFTVACGLSLLLADLPLFEWSYCTFTIAKHAAASKRTGMDEAYALRVSHDASSKRTLYKSLTMPFAVGERRFDHRTRIVVLFRQMLHGAGSQGIDARLWRIVRSTTFLCAQSGELRTDLPCPKSSFLVRSGGLRASLLLRSTVEGAIGARSSQTRCWRGESRRRDGGGVPVAH
jgi:hypothetical protein